MFWKSRAILRKYRISAFAVSKSCKEIRKIQSYTGWYPTCISEASAGFPESIVTVVRVSADTPDPIVIPFTYSVPQRSLNDVPYCGFWCTCVLFVSETASGVTAISSNDTAKLKGREGEIRQKEVNCLKSQVAESI